jgi:hypothetical protein
MNTTITFNSLDDFWHNVKSEIKLGKFGKGRHGKVLDYEDVKYFIDRHLTDIAYANENGKEATALRRNESGETYVVLDLASLPKYDDLLKEQKSSFVKKHSKKAANGTSN